MKKVNSFFLFVTIPFLSLSQYGGVTNSTDTERGQALLARQKQASLFEENKGQVTGTDSEKVKYTYKDGGLSLFLLDNGIAYQFNKYHYPEFTESEGAFDDEFRQNDLPEELAMETYRMDVLLIDANPHAKITTEGKSKDYVQYYNHNALNVHSYSKIIYHNVYPEIDWVIYKSGRNIKYDFVVHPGGNPEQIKLKTEWVEDLKLTRDGSLVLKNQLGNITEKKPVSFQNNTEIETKFHLENDVLSFKLEKYAQGEKLVIDPVLQWATYYGGTANDYGYSCLVDGSGNVYMAGGTNSTTNIADGGHQISFQGGHSDAFLVKFNAAGVRQWATYYGGTESEYGRCALDASGYVYLFGSTKSTENIASGGHQNSINGTEYDAFIVKFDSDGVRQWGTYYGGADEERARACAVDASGNVFLTGRTLSTDDIASGGHQNTHGGGSSDAFLVKFNSAGVRQWATYYGGNDIDWSWGCAIDGANHIYIAGWTGSGNNIAGGGYQNSIGGFTDAFITKFDTDGVVQWSTYYGGTSYDRGRACTVDGADNVYLVGFTESTNNIASATAHQSTHGGGWDDAFIVKFNSAGVRQWATYYGGNNEDLGWACTVDGSDNVYLAGMSTSVNNIGFGGHQTVFGGGGDDGFLVKFDSDGTRQWATYYGGTAIDRGWACGVDVSSDHVYLAGSTLSASGISIDGHQNTIGGGEDAFLVKFDGDGEIIIAGLDSETFEIFSLFPNPSTGEITITFVDEGNKSVAIYNPAGMLVYEKELMLMEEFLNLNHLSSGLYHLKVQTSNGSSVKGFILNR